MEKDAQPDASTTTGLDKQNMRNSHVIKSGKFAGRKTGGGGKRRGSLCKFIKLVYNNRASKKKASKEGKSSLMKQAHRLAKEAEDADPKHWKVVGESGTASHSTGRAAFGRVVDKRRGLPRKVLQSLCPEPAEPEEEHQVSAIGPRGDGPRTAVRRDAESVAVLETLRIQRWNMSNSTEDAVPQLSSFPSSASATLQLAGNSGATVMKWKARLKLLLTAYSRGSWTTMASSLTRKKTCWRHGLSGARAPMVLTARKLPPPSFP